MVNESEDKQQTIATILRRLASLYVENVRLTAAEKISILFSTIALFAILIVLALIILILIAIGLACALENYISPSWSYFIIAGILALVLVGFFVFREKIIVNPISRFISRLFINPPKND